MKKEIKQSCQNCRSRIGTFCNKNKGYVTLLDWCSAWGMVKMKKEGEE